MLNKTTNPSSFLMALMLLVSLLMLAGCSDSYDDGLTAYEDKDYAKALKIWRPLADRGDAEAQFSLGYMYAQGQGVVLGDGALTFVTGGYGHAPLLGQFL